MTIEDLNKRNSKGCREVKMSELEYRSKYSNYKTKLNSYDKETKTLIVYTPEGVELKHEQKPKVKYKAVKMYYGIYRRKYLRYSVKKDSYDSSDKSIIVYIPEDVANNIDEKSLKPPEKLVWHCIRFNAVLRVRKSKKSQMFMLPADTKYWGYSVWIPNKLIECDEDEYVVSFSNKFTLTLFKESRDDAGKYIRTCEMKVTGDDFFKELKNSSRRCDTYVPPHLEPVHTEVLKELMDIG